MLSQSATVLAMALPASFGASLFMSSRSQRKVSDSTAKGSDDARVPTNNLGLRIADTPEDETPFDRRSELETAGNKEQAVRALHAQLEKQADELSLARRRLEQETARRLLAEQKLEQSRQEFVKTARDAGLAEIAASVLGDLEGVLRGIDVSSSLAHHRVQCSHVNEFREAVELINQHRHDLHDFLAGDAVGRGLPRLLSILAGRMSTLHDDIVEQLSRTALQIDHARSLIATQQSHAACRPREARDASAMPAI